LLQFRQSLHNLHRLHTHRHHFFDQPHNVFGIIGAVRIVRDAAALVGFDTILVYDPVESGTVTEAVFKGFGGNAAEGQKLVVDDLDFVFGEFHLLDTPIQTEDVLTAHPELDGIYCHSDFTLAGVIPALKRVGRLEPVGHEKHIYTVSIDATSQALDWIRERQHDASVSQPFIAYGTLAVEFFAEYYLKERPIPVGETLTRSGVLWSPAAIEDAPTGPMINLRTTPVDIHNVDDPRLWANYYGYLQKK